ncbi:MAG: ribonuclease M5 [Anaerococcus sp.]|nr:ribonuclease M5 [Anaerococcus sp.]
MIKETIVVEGKDDIANVKRAVDCELVATGGLSFDKGFIDNLKVINERCGIIILTDPDYAGKKIRARISRHIPDAKHAYIDRKSAIKKGDLGVENADPLVIREALRRARASEVSKREVFTMVDLYKNSLSVGKNSKERRARLGKLLGIGYYNSKQLLSKLNSFNISRDEFERAVEKL